MCDVATAVNSSNSLGSALIIPAGHFCWSLLLVDCARDRIDHASCKHTTDNTGSWLLASSALNCKERWNNATPYSLLSINLWQGEIVQAGSRVVQPYLMVQTVPRTTTHSTVAQLMHTFMHGPIDRVHRLFRSILLLYYYIFHNHAGPLITTNTHSGSEPVQAGVATQSV